MLTYGWEFWGPQAEGTAVHFRAHLEEFLAKHGLTGCRTGTWSQAWNHCGVWCHTPPEHGPSIEAALRPKHRRAGPPPGEEQPPPS